MSLEDFLSKANATMDLSKVHNGKASEFSYIANFIRDNSIVEGPNTVTPDYIYALYCEQNRPPIARRKFTAYLRSFFKTHKTCNIIFFRLDPTPFKLPEGWTIWKELGQTKFKYQKTKFSNIKHTPEGWMIFVELTLGRKIFGWADKEKEAARLADKAAWFYYGPLYDKFNYPSSVEGLTNDDPELQDMLQLKKVGHGAQKKESL
jgi:hypothetical protein